jgi:hypothetical protein
MAKFQFSRSYLIAAVMALAVFGWLIVIAIIVVDSVIIPPTTPTPANTAVIPTNVAVVLTPTAITSTDATATIEHTATNLPPTLIITEVFVQPSREPTLQPTEVPTSAAADNPTTAPGTLNQPASINCKSPDGWTAYNVEEGDTLFGFVLGSKGTLTVDSIMAANCLTTKFLAVGQTVFLPPGVSDQSPKVDNAPPPIVSDPGTNPDGSLPSNPSRIPKCPCTIAVRVGWRLEQIAAAVDAVPVSFSGADFIATVAAGAPAPSLPILSSRPAGKSLEGFMFPGSYSLENATSAVQFRDMMLNAFAANVSGQVQADAAARGLTFWEAVVLASIIQKESGAPSEQALIGSVFHNRLSQNKGLAATVTIQYAIGVPGNWWPRVRSVNVKSPYNTYIYAGLPPGPISNTTLSAIMAAVYPAQTNYLYFSGKCGGGGNFYAATFAEFEQGLKCN